MAFPATLTQALTDAGDLSGSIEALLVDLVGLAQEVIITDIRIQQTGVDDNDVAVMFRLRSTGLTDVNAGLFRDLKAAVL